MENQIIVTKTFYKDFVKNNEDTPKKHIFMWSFWVFVLAIFLCIIILPLFISTEDSRVFGKTFFALSVGSFESLVRASDLADDVSDRGGAGFILTGKVCRVVVFAYKNQKDALLVSKKLEGFESEIVQISIEKIPPKFRKSSKILKMERVLSEWVYKMYDASIDMDRGDMTEGEVVIVVTSIYKGLSQQKQVFTDSEFFGVFEAIQRLYDEACDFLKLHREPNKISSNTKHFFISLIIESQNIANYLAEC